MVSQGYSMKLQTQMLRVCEISKFFVIHTNHLCYILKLCALNSVVSFSAKVPVCHFRLDDGVAPKDILSS